MAITTLLPQTVPVDGVYRAALDLTTSLKRDGHQIDLLTITHGNGRSEWEKVAHVREAAPFLGGTWRSPGWIRRTASLAASLPPEAQVVVAHRIDLLNAGAVCSVRQSAPFVYHAHNEPPDWARWGHWIRIPGSRRVQTIVVASDFMREKFEEFVGDVTPVVVVPYPIRSDRLPPVTEESRRAARIELNLDPDVLVLGYIGRIGEEKGLDVLAAAASQLAGGDRVHVLFQGAPNVGVTAESTEKFKERCNALVGPATCSWLEPNPDIRTVVAAADVMVVPSVWREPSGLTVSEALCSGARVVASATGGITEQLPESPLVAAVTPGDANELARAIERVVAVEATATRRLDLRRHVETTRSPDAVASRYWQALTGAP